MSGRRRSFRKRQKPPFQRFKDHLRNFLAFMFSNVGIILLVISYTIGGAFIFQAIEIAESQRMGNPRAKELKMAGERNISVIVESLWRITCCETNVFNKTEFEKRVNQTIFDYQNALIKVELLGMEVEKQWSFSGAFLYSLTVITTIGYGNISPKSIWGKIFTILYAIIGMPLFLLYLSNIGDILAKSFKWIYARICLCRICPGVAKRRMMRERFKIRQMAMKKVLSEHENSKRLRCQNDESSSSSSVSIEINFIDDELDDYEVEIQTDIATITVPLTVCVSIMIGYILFGATLFARWEHWNLLDGSYFCFISLSSIGFGDIVPGEEVIGADQNKVEVSFILCAVYLLLGMALIAMCFNLMQEQVMHEIRSIKRLIQVCFRCKR